MRSFKANRHAPHNGDYTNSDRSLPLPVEHVWCFSCVLCNASFVDVLSIFYFDRVETFDQSLLQQKVQRMCVGEAPSCRCRHHDNLLLDPNVVNTDTYICIRLSSDQCLRNVLSHKTRHTCVCMGSCPCTCEHINMST